MSNLMMLPCEYCRRLCAWPVKIASYGIPPCCPDCRIRPVVNISIALIVVAAAGFVGWAVHVALQSVMP